MDKLISAFPSNITAALAIAEGVNFLTPKERIDSIIILGMGGSGIGGKLVSQWLQAECLVPIIVCQDYEIPAFVTKNSLVIGSSYSGNTEETLTALAAAKEKNAHIIGVCSGGNLANFCKENDFDFVVVPGGNPPRTALAFSLVQLCNIFGKLGFSSMERLQEIENGGKLIVEDLAAIQKEAHAIAAVLEGKVHITLAGANYEALAIRARQQFNENSKMLGWQCVIPEMNHNELVGWGGGDDRFAVLCLQTNDLSVKNQRRYEISLERIKSKTSFVHETIAKGNNPIEKTIYLIHVIDWASLYLSNLKNGDPIEIEIIDFLKDELGKM